MLGLLGMKSKIIFAEATQQRLYLVNTDQFVEKCFTREIQACPQVLRNSQAGTEPSQRATLASVVSPG